MNRAEAVEEDQQPTEQKADPLQTDLKAFAAQISTMSGPDTVKRYGRAVRTVQGDIRQWETFQDGAFDVVAQGYSINYVSEVQSVFDSVVRNLRAGCIYELGCHNPFIQGLWVDTCWGSEWPKEHLWKGQGYPLCLSYIEGAQIRTWDPHCTTSTAIGTRGGYGRHRSSVIC